MSTENRKVARVVVYLVEKKNRNKKNMKQIHEVMREGIRTQDLRITGALL